MAFPFYFWIYDLWSTINVQVFFGFCRKLARTKPNNAQTKRANITGVQYFLAGFGLSYVRMNNSGFNFVLSFILSFLRQLSFSNFLESYVSEFRKFPKVSIRNLPDKKLFNGLYLLRIVLEFRMRYAHSKEVPVSNPITSRKFVQNLVLKSSERDRL